MQGLSLLIAMAVLLVAASVAAADPATVNTTVNTIKAPPDNTGDAIEDIQADDASGESPSRVTDDGWYAVDKGYIMFIDGFNTTGISGGITGVVLNVQYSVEDGYDGSNPVQWALDAGILTTTGIKPVNGEEDKVASYDLYTQGVDTVGEISTLDVEFTNNDGGSQNDAVSFDYVFVTVTCIPMPDLIPTAIAYNLDKGGELFANQPNDIRVRINNTGTSAAGAFDVTLEIESYTETRSIPSLAAGAYTFVTFTGYAPPTNGSKIVNITVDKENAIAESDETNNLRTWTRIVYYNGYKGKRWTDGEDIVTVETYSLKGNITYSVGNSYYMGVGWKTYTANWPASDLPLPSDAVIQSAKLYVSYNWDQTNGALWGDDTTFNGITYPGAGASHYTDKKMWGIYADHAYGFVVYNVTANFNKSGNTVTLGDATTARTVAIDGMILQVVYSHPNEPARKIWLNEGYDLLMADITKGTDTNETIAYAPFTGGSAIDLANVASARLIAVGPGAGDTTGNKSNVIFNNNSHWDVLPPFISPTEIAIADINVTSELGTSNEAVIQDNGDSAGMRIATVILVVETVPAPPPSSPYMIYGWVFYENQTACNNPVVNITNLNSSTLWQAEKNSSYNYYQLILDSRNVSAGDVLEFNVTDGTKHNTTTHTVTTGDINSGGVFDFNLTLPSGSQTDGPTVDSITITPDDDGSTSGVQVDPNPGGAKTVTVTVVVSDPNGYGDINSVNITDINPDPAHGDPSPVTLMFQSGNGNTATYNGTFDMQFYDQPVEYTVMVTAKDTNGSSDTDSSTFNYTSYIAMSLDSGTIAFGSIDPGENNTVAGDKNMTTTGSPTLRNIGNVVIDVNITGSNMTSGSNTITKDHMDAQVGILGYSNLRVARCFDANMAAGLSSLENVDFRLNVPYGIPAGSYNGSVTLTAYTCG